MDEDGKETPFHFTCGLRDLASIYRDTYALWLLHLDCNRAMQDRFNFINTNHAVDVGGTLKAINERHLRGIWRASAETQFTLNVYQYGICLKDGLQRRPAGRWSDDIDFDAIASARRCYDEAFPQIKDMRNAVAHVYERNAGPDRFNKNSFSGSHESPGLSISNVERGSLSIGTESGRAITFDGKIVQIVVSLDGLQVLKSVGETVWNAVPDMNGSKFWQCPPGWASL